MEKAGSLMNKACTDAWLAKSVQELSDYSLGKFAADLVTQTEFHHHIGGENICLSLRAAVERAREILKLPGH